MSKRFLVFQHTAWEGPGKYLIDAAEKQKIRLDPIKLWKKIIPSLTPYDGLLVLDGHPNIKDDSPYPFLPEEKEAIKEWVDSNRPYLGACPRIEAVAKS